MRFNGDFHYLLQRRPAPPQGQLFVSADPDLGEDSQLYRDFRD
jgi:hypothetical protein